MVPETAPEHADAISLQLLEHLRNTHRRFLLHQEFISVTRRDPILFFTPRNAASLHTGSINVALWFVGLLCLCLMLNAPSAFPRWRGAVRGIVHADKETLRA